MKTKKWIWGIFFICAAALVITNQLGQFTNIGLLNLIFTIILIPIMIESIAHLHFSGILFPLALLSIIYAQQLGIQQLTPWPVLIAALFLSIGFSIIFKRKKHWDTSQHRDFRHHEKFADTIDYLEEDDVDCKVSFGASSKYLHSASLRKASLGCSFGALKVFFDNTQLHPDGADIYIDCSFSGMELYIPKSWKVVDHMLVTLGGVDEKNHHGELSGPVLTLTGKVSFGAVEIIYI